MLRLALHTCASGDISYGTVFRAVKRLEREQKLENFDQWVILLIHLLPLKAQVH